MPTPSEDKVLLRTLWHSKRVVKLARRPVKPARYDGRHVGSKSVVYKPATTDKALGIKDPIAGLENQRQVGVDRVER
jgi:hypothetical protein